MIAHWDDVDGERLEEGHLCGTWADLGEAAGTKRVGVTRIQIEPGRWSTPAHIELDEEEIYFILGGRGLLWQDGATHDVRAGDCVVQPVATHVRTFRADDEGLELLAFGERTNATATFLPRAKVLRMGVTVDVSQGPHPWEREAAAGEPELPEPTKRPENVVNLDELEGEFGGIAKRPAEAAGSERTGLNWVALPPNEEGAPPHCHSAEEEIFVILAGGGTLELWPSPAATRVTPDAAREDVPLRAGHVVSRPAATRVGHCLRAGDEGMTYLAYGTREPNDICYYPRSNKIFWRGVGLIARLDHLDYFDGEPGRD